MNKVQYTEIDTSTETTSSSFIHKKLETGNFFTNKFSMNTDFNRM